MKLLTLNVEHFRCVRKSGLEFSPGLNVLHGPNDIGKSSLAAAIRAALLLQTSSKESEEFVSWYGTGDPHVELVFESEPQRIWRVKKTFGSVSQAFLEESRDGVDFHVEARGRDVDGRLSEILRWGLAPPGGKGRPRVPVTFLSTALLAKQDEVKAIFDKSLSEDSDESGKKLLVEALQAAAEDPLFKSVLHIVQARVDEAFSASGQRSRRKDSPWIKLREQIRLSEKEESDCREQLQKTTSIESELQDLLSRRLEFEAHLTKATEDLRTAESEHNQAVRRAEICTRLKERADRLSEITSSIKRFADARSNYTELSQTIERLVQREKEAQLSLAEKAKRLEVAREDVRNQSAERERERQRKRSAIEATRAATLSEQVTNGVAVSRLTAIESIAQRTRMLESAVAVLEKQIIELTNRHDEDLKALQELDEREGELSEIAQLLRGKLAKANISEAENSLAQIEEWRKESNRLRSDAVAIEATIGATTLPSAENLDLLKELENKIRVARARLGVGLHVALIPKREVVIAIRRDGGRPEEIRSKDSPVEANAEREIQLDIDGIVEINLTGGEAEARDEATRLQGQWAAEAEPLFRGTGFASVDDVVTATKAQAKSLGEVSRLRQLADGLDQRVRDQRDWGSILAERQRDLESAESGLNKRDRERFGAVALKLKITDPGDAEKLIANLRVQRSKLVDHARIPEAELATARTLSNEKQKELIAAREELLLAQAAVDGYSDDLLTQLVDRQSQIASELAAAGQKLQELDLHIDTGLTAARGLLDTAENEHGRAETTHREVAEELRMADSNRAILEGELRILGESVAKLDEGEARQAVVAIETELAGVVEPTREVTEQMLSGLQSVATGAKGKLAEINDAIHKKSGALQHVGGEVAKGRSADAEEALRILREKERALEIDYEAWALLRETLLEAEQEEGVHLGKVLGDPIVQRFSDLTGGRYGALALGPDLETEKITVAGDGRPVGSLSVGTRDQLSIIFRLTLAEQLRSVVVLDDQLTQSDSQRLMWLRDLLRQTAANIQILVFTCRPADYLSPAELKPSKRPEHLTMAVRSIDLSQKIERFGSQPSAESSLSRG
jgi:DNA repair exonuclease SbcCD ATPase subunit